MISRRLVTYQAPEAQLQTLPRWTAYADQLRGAEYRLSECELEFICRDAGTNTGTASIKENRRPPAHVPRPVRAKRRPQSGPLTEPLAKARTDHYTCVRPDKAHSGDMSRRAGEQVK